MAYTVKKFGDHRERRSYAKTKNAIELGNLLEVQKKSYNWFIEEGIKEVFEDLNLENTLLTNQDIPLRVVKKDTLLMLHL